MTCKRYLIRVAVVLILTSAFLEGAPPFLRFVQCSNSLYQVTIVCFLTRMFFPDNSHILEQVF